MASNNTFEDVEKFIADNGLFFSDADLNLARTNPDAGMTIANYKLDYKNATTDDQRAVANAGAESTRKNYGGYTGGSDGSKFYLTEPSPQNYGYQQPTDQQSSFTYQQPGAQAGVVDGGLNTGGSNNTTQKEASNGANIGQYSDWKNPYQDLMNSALDNIVNREEYKNPYEADMESIYNTVMNQGSWENPYSAQQQAALDAVMNRKEFNYDPSQDAAYQAARKQYLREADRATQDTLGQAAGLTGGMASTAAITAANQAGDYYRTQLNDRLGEYQQAAYDRYMNDANLDFSQLDAINNMSEADYAKYLDSFNQNLSKYNTTKDMSESDYQKYVDALGFDYDQASLLNTLGQQARAEFDTDRNFGYNQWTDELAYQTDKENTKYDREQAKEQQDYEREQAKEQQDYERAQYAKEYADSTNDSLAKIYLSLYDSTLNSKYLDMALERIKALQG